MSTDLNIAVWNCYRGDPDARLAELGSFSPHVAVLTESLAPKAESPQAAWALHSGKLGIAVLACGGYSVERLPVEGAETPSAAPFLISGPASFLLLAVWTFPEPTYSHALRKVIDTYGQLISSRPTVVAGDFNSNPIWDAESKSVNHSVNEARLRACGLKSAYHAFTGEEAGRESVPTLYHQWNQDRGFHIDYCFVPEAWAVRGAVVPGFEAFSSSDHRPLAVSVTIPAAADARVA